MPDWYRDDLVAAHRDRMTDGYRGPQRLMQMSLDWATQRLINLYHAWRETLVDILHRLGLESVAVYQADSRGCADSCRSRRGVAGRCRTGPR